MVIIDVWATLGGARFPLSTVGFVSTGLGFRVLGFRGLGFRVYRV